MADDRCAATTNAGAACSRKAFGRMSIFCMQHQNRAFRKLYEHDRGLASPATPEQKIAERKVRG